MAGKTVEFSAAERARVATMQSRIASLTAELAGYQYGLEAMLTTMAERMGHEGECQLSSDNKALLLVGYKGGTDGVAVE